ncbi:phage major capsid protein [Populibacterium corticicola]|uniref:Phage major capsid protein n=1 Tax=Populibacterium corticicola TaxID=1812826 RepID=A0ABW5XFU6_9MICO
MSTKLLERAHLLIREFNEETREFTGIAVPYDTPTRVRDWWYGTEYDESVERGAVVDSDDAKIFWQHREAIGKVISARDTDEGWEITGYLSRTARGDEAYILLRDGVIDRLSIGFEPIEHREVKATKDQVAQIIRTKIRVREVSLVNFPAYEGAAVSEVRHQTTPPPTIEMENTRMDPETLAPLHEAIEDLKRGQTLLTQQIDTASATDVAPLSQFRSAGEFLKAAIAPDGDEARAEYTEMLERAYTGATTTDTIMKDTWVGDLTRLIETPNPLSDVFSTGQLPATGLTLEYGQLKSDTTTVTEQENEGDDLAYGKVDLETKSAEVKTYGGYTSLTRQLIERSSVNYIDTALRALALAAARRRIIGQRAAFAAAVTRETAAGNTVSAGAGTTYTAWVEAIIDAAEKFIDLGLPLDKLVTSKGIFKTLATLTDSAGRPLMTVVDDGTNSIGRISPKALTGNLAGVEVRLNLKQAAEGAAFTNPLAIRSYTSPVARLQDENIINLSKDFSLYFYEAIAHEIPKAIVPVVITPGSGD